MLEMLVLLEGRGRRRRRIAYNIMVSFCGILSEQATEVEVVNLTMGENRNRRNGWWGSYD